MPPPAVMREVYINFDKHHMSTTVGGLAWEGHGSSESMRQKN